MTIKLEVGKRYKRRDGRGPVKILNQERDGGMAADMYQSDDIYYYWGNGRRYFSHETPADLVAEWVDEPVNAAQAPDTNPLKALLDEATETVAARGKPYGGVEDNFERIARLWTAHLANRYNAHAILKLDGTDVALMMVMLKVARLANDPAHRDSWVDIAGYAACGGSLPKP